MLKTQEVFWWRTGSANTEGKLGKEPDGEMGSEKRGAFLFFSGNKKFIHFLENQIN